MFLSITDSFVLVEYEDLQNRRDLTSGRADSVSKFLRAGQTLADNQKNKFDIKRARNYWKTRPTRPARRLQALLYIS